jgi:membrane protease YdiL (CAAX protease family)
MTRTIPSPFVSNGERTDPGPPTMAGQALFDALPAPPRPDTLRQGLDDLHWPRIPEATWGLLDMVPVLLMPFGATFLALVFFGGLFHRAGGAYATVFGYMLELSFAAAVLFWVRYIHRAPAAQLGWRRGHLGEDAALGLAVGLGTIVLAGIVSTLTREVASLILGHRATPPQAVPSSVHGIWLALTGPLLVLAAPLCEELLFRGFVYRGFRRRFSFWPAALMSAGLFALAHVSPLSIPYVFVDGIVLAWIFELRQSIVASFTAHAMNNLIVFLVILAVR